MKKLIRVVILTLCLFSLCGIYTNGNGVVNVEAASNTNDKFQMAQPTLKIENRSATTANLSISTVNGATGYRVYRATTKDGTYSYVGNTKTNTFKDSDLTSSKSYYYKVRAYKTVNGNNVYSKYSSKIKLDKTLAKSSSVSAKASSNSKIKISWSSVSGATSYKVYRATSKSGTYSYVGSSKSLSYTDSGLNSGTTYYYKVRASKVASGITYNGVYSSIVSAKTTTGSSNQESDNNANSDYATEVLKLINKERKAAGLKEVSTTSSLSKAANKRAQEIVSVFSHSRPDGSSCFTALDDFNISYQAAGENIAYGQKTPEQVMEGWMNSSGHRANILSSKFGKVGIGCYEKNGTLYWTQLFTD